MRFLKNIVLLIITALVLSGCGSSDNPVATLNAAADALAKGNYSNARKLASKAVALDEQNPNAHIVEAIAYMHCNNHEEAMKSATKATQIDPESFIAQYTLGNIASKNRTTNYDALVALGKALELRPNDRETIILLANVNMKFNPKQALKYLIRLQSDAQLLNSAAYQNQIAICMTMQGTAKQVTQAFLKACRLAPNEPIPFLNLALFMDQYQNNSQVALSLYTKYLSLVTPDDSNAESRKFVDERIKAINK